MKLLLLIFLILTGEVALMAFLVSLSTQYVPSNGWFCVALIASCAIPTAIGYKLMKML